MGRARVDLAHGAIPGGPLGPPHGRHVRPEDFADVQGPVLSAGSVAYFVPDPAAGFFFSSVCMRRIQSPSVGVGNWQVLEVTTATAGLFSPVRGLNHVMLGEGGRASSLISTVRTPGM